MEFDKKKYEHLISRELVLLVKEKWGRVPMEFELGEFMDQKPTANCPDCLKEMHLVPSLEGKGSFSFYCHYCERDEEFSDKEDMYLH